MKRFTKIFAVLVIGIVAVLVARRQTRDLRSISWEELTGRRKVTAMENFLRLLPAGLPGRSWLDQQLREMGTCNAETPLTFAAPLVFDPKKDEFFNATCSDGAGGKFQIFIATTTTFRLDREGDQPITFTLSDGQAQINLSKGSFRFYVNTTQLTLRATEDQACGVLITTVAGSAQLAIGSCDLKIDIPTAALGNAKTTPLTITATRGAKVELPGLSIKEGEVAVLAPSGLRKFTIPGTTPQ